MTEAEFDIHEPYRWYAYMMLLFICDECGRYLDTDPPFSEQSDWQWFHDAAEQAWRSGWYVATNLPDGSDTFFCLCSKCAAQKKLRPPVTRQ